MIDHAHERLDSEVRYAERVQAGVPLEERGRWITSESQRELLREVMERRSQAKERWGDLAADLPPIRALEKQSA